MHLTSTVRATSDISCVINRPDLGLYGVISGTSRLQPLALGAATFAAQRLEKMYQAAGRQSAFSPSMALAAVHTDLIEYGDEQGPEFEVTAVLAHAYPPEPNWITVRVAAWGNCRAYRYRTGRRHIKGLTIDNTTGTETDLVRRNTRQYQHGRVARRADPPPPTLRLGDPEWPVVSPRPLRDKLSPGDYLALLCPLTTHQHLYADLVNIFHTSDNLEEAADSINVSDNGALIVITPAA